MNKVSKQELFENTAIPKAVLTLSIPTVLSSLVMVLYNMADTYFVGMLNDPIQNAAVTFAAPVMLAFNAVNNLFGVGASSMMSRSIGSKDYDTVHRASAFGFWGAVSFGLLLSILVSVFLGPLLRLLGASGDNLSTTADYMFWTVCLGAVPSILNVVMAYLVRSEGATLHASIGTMSGCILNIILDPIFILSLGMGAAGAGLATFISNCIACLYFFVLLIVKRGNTFVCIDPRKVSFKRNIVFGICGVGIPASIQNLLNVTGMTVLNNLTAAAGDAAVAAMGISQKIGMIPMYISMGISQGVMPLIGYNYGSRNVKRMRDTVGFSACISIGFLTLCTVLFSVFSSPLIRLFMSDPDVVAFGSRFLRGFALAQPFLAMDFLAVGVFQACGMGKKALIFAFLRKIALEIPALIVLNKLFPVYGLAYAQFAAEIVLAVAAVFTLRSLFKKLDATLSNNEGA